MKITNEITLETVKNNKLFRLVFPGDVTYPECLDVLKEMHNSLIEDAKKKEEQLKKMKEEQEVKTQDNPVEVKEE